ncbi:MAG: phage baseplate assembly protein V [Deltaproteobacteria bacterium]|nr:phage baseplate assembly protein V [Deltaproteobacteria bacterium]
MPKVTDRLGRPFSGQMPGLVEALVTDNEDPNHLGRVKVKFPTLPDMPESFWARVVTPMAGQDRGWVAIPEIDDEVLVAFVHGDINHAVVLGSLHNGKDTPPYANEDGDNNLRVFKSRSGHKLTFDDTDGAEKIELVTPDEGVRVVLDASANTLSVQTQKDIVLEAGSKIALKCADFELKADGAVSIDAGTNLKLKAGANLDVEAGTTLTAKGSIVNIN